MKRSYPYIRAMWPGIAVMVRNESDERFYRRADLIGISLWVGALVLTGGWMAWRVFA